MRELFDEVVQGALPSPLYERVHGATVRFQREDGTLDLEVDGGVFDPLVRVPFRVGIPSARVVLPEGARVRLAFEGGSRSAPYAFAPDQDTSAEKAVAYKGAAVQVALLYTGPGAVTPVPLGTPGAIVLSGEITEGDDAVKVRGS